MNEIRKFKVLKNTYGRMSIYEGRPLMRKGEIVEVEVLKNNIYVYDNWRFHPSWFDMWLTEGYLEEILPDKKPISSEENEFENPYGRQIYLAEAIHALTNHEVLIKDKYGYIWDYDKIDETFYTYDESGYTIVITDKYTVKELLEFQFDVIPKSIEEVKEKWVEIETHKELATAIVNKKMIRLGDGKPTNSYNNKQIETLFGALEHGVFKIEYLDDSMKQ